MLFIFMFLIGVFHRLLRSHILRLSCYGGHAGCTQNITNLFQPWIQDPMSVQSTCTLSQIKCFIYGHLNHFIGLYAVDNLQVKFISLRANRLISVYHAQELRFVGMQLHLTALIANWSCDKFQYIHCFRSTYSCLEINFC